MDILDKNSTKNMPKSRRLWLILVAIPIVLVIISSLAILGLYILKKSVNSGVEKGLVYANSNRNKRAIMEFKNALVKNPNDATAHYYMGQSYIKLKEYDKSIAEFREAIRINPDFYEPQIQLAMLNLKIARELKRQHKTESMALEKLIKAEKICEKIIEINPGLIRAHILLSEIYLTKGLVKDAIEKYKDVIELDNSFKKAHIALARLYIQEGEIDLAKEQCNIILHEIDPDNYQMQILLSTIHIQLGKLNKAIVRLKQLLEKRPNDTNVHTQLAVLYLQTLKYEDALNEAEQVFKLTQSAAVAPPPAAHFVKGSVLLQRKDYINAIPFLRKTTIQLPNMAQAHFFLALALAAAGRTEQAISEFNTAIKIDPEFVPAQISLSRLLAWEGSLKETIDLSKNVLKIEPENAEAMQILSSAGTKTANLKISGEKSEESILFPALTFGKNYFNIDNELSIINTLQIYKTQKRRPTLQSTLGIEPFNQIYVDYEISALNRDEGAVSTETTIPSCIFREIFILFDEIRDCGLNPICLTDKSLDTAISLAGCFFNSK